MDSTRSIAQVIKSQPALEGAGVHLRRVFGHQHRGLFDPFLLLDDFHSDDPEKYLPGFPWHPHRGIETITYVLHGDVEHADSLGNQGIIHSGDVQWMTAGSGIVHQEMPSGDPQDRLWGFQLWANLPASHKMMTPRYRDVTSSQIPEVSLEGGGTVRVICGRVGEICGPVEEIVIDPQYLDVSLPAGTAFIHPIPSGYTAFAYVIKGDGYFDNHTQEAIFAEDLVLFTDGEQISIRAGDSAVRFLFIAGKPIGEPIAWYGPIVMNTQEELEQAFDEYSQGTFLRHKQ